MDSSEPSTSLELTLYKKPSKCVICNKPAHGFHHGALTCRACCVFFRRSAEFQQRWKCKKDQKCDTDGKHFPCKKCRLEKCFKNGMTVENFQFERDCKSVLHTREAMPTSLEKFLGRPHMIIRCEPKTSKTKITFLDLSGLVDRGSDILSKTHKTSLNGIEKLADYMRKVRGFNTHGKEVYRKIGQAETRMFWQMDFCQTAEWLSHFDEFHGLCISLKMEFLKSIWYLWSVLERLSIAIENHSKSNESSGLKISFDKYTMVDVEKMEYDLSWCTEYELDKLGYFFDLVTEFQHLKRFAEVMIDLKPTDVEQTFVFLHICFSYAGRVHQGEILKISEKLLENVSNQMHNYYVNVMKRTNYAGRLAKLMKCDKFIQEFIMNRKQKIEIAQIFDIFNLHTSHPEMFVVSGF